MGTNDKNKENISEEKVVKYFQPQSERVKTSIIGKIQSELLAKGMSNEQVFGLLLESELIKCYVDPLPLTQTQEEYERKLKEILERIEREKERKVAVMRPYKSQYQKMMVRSNQIKKEINLRKQAQGYRKGKGSNRNTGNDTAN